MLPSPRSTVHTPKAMPLTRRSTSRNPATTEPKPLEGASSASSVSEARGASSRVDTAFAGPLCGALAGAGAGSTFARTATVRSSSSSGTDEAGAGAWEENTAMGAAQVSSPSSSSKVPVGASTPMASKGVGVRRSEDCTF